MRGAPGAPLPRDERRRRRTPMSLPRQRVPWTASRPFWSIMKMSCGPGLGRCEMGSCTLLWLHHDTSVAPTSGLHSGRLCLRA